MADQPVQSGQLPITAPGGVRAANTMHTVSPGQAVLESPAGAFVTDAATTSGTVDQAMVVTPGGYRLKSRVHHIRPGTSLDGEDYNLRQVHASGEILQDFGRLSPHPGDKPLMPDNVSLSPKPTASNTSTDVAPATFGQGWITATFWTNNTGKPITSFATTWEVPPPPIARTVPSGQRHIIFIFNGIQNSTNIYQPVLQWGDNGAGGGDYWTVASWYADGQTGPSFHSNWVRVEPGQIITGLITLTGQTGNKFNYNCEFVGIANTSLPITNVEQLTWCIETLECYGISGASSYPPTYCTPMKNIQMVTGSTSPTLVWTPSNTVQDCGQHSMVISNANPGGEVDLCYGTVAPPSTAAVSWDAGRLDIFAIGRDAQCYQRTWNGQTWQGWTGIGGAFNSPITAVSWGPNRIDLFGLGRDNQCYHKAWTGTAWSPPGSGWDALGGVFDGPLTAVSRTAGTLDIFGVGTDSQCYHKSWDGTKWSPSITTWETLGGNFNSPLTAVSWGSDRMDVFGLGTDNQCNHKYWTESGGWGPSITGWEAIGGVFNSAVTAVCYGPGRIDLFGLGTDNAIYHKWYEGGWGVSQTFWERFGGVFTSLATAVSWGKNRLDVFAIGRDNAMYHKYSDDGGWKPAGFESLGGAFNSAPSAVCWGADRIDIFGFAANNNSMLHKTLTATGVGSTGATWENLGGIWLPD